MNQSLNIIKLKYCKLYYIITFRPEDYKLNQEHIKSSINASCLVTAKEIIKESTIEKDVDELEKESKEKLLSIIEEAKQNIKKTFTNNTLTEEYYKSITQCLNLGTTEEENEKMFTQKKPQKINLDKLNSHRI